VGIFAAIRGFFIDVRAEFLRVSWPTRDATLKSTAVVVFVTVVIAVYLGIIDVGLSEFMKRIIG
jgi:preprotein translocase subunit SecE